MCTGKGQFAPYNHAAPDNIVNYPRTKAYFKLNYDYLANLRKYAYLAR